jgi:hypothetical protein
LIADSFMRTDPCYEEVVFPGDQCPSARSIRRPSHHARKRGVPVHRLPALSARHGPLDGSRAPAQERELADDTIKRFDCYPEGSIILTQLGVVGNLGAALVTQA